MLAEIKKVREESKMKEILEKVHNILWERFYASNDIDLSPQFFEDAKLFRQFFKEWQEEEFKKQQEKWVRKYSKTILNLAEKIRQEKINKTLNRRFLLRERINEIKT